MKALILIISLALSSSTVFAAGSSVEKLLPNIKDRVRSCAILPFAMNNNNVRVEHALKSHCPEVKLVPPADGSTKFNTAKIRVAGHQFTAQLIETVYSDGDLFDVEIRDIVTNETYRSYNVLAFGDVLLGVLEGKTTGIVNSLISE